MGSYAILFLALVARAEAGPISDSTRAVDACAKTCTASSKFNYEPGTTYDFQYNNEIRTTILGAAEDHAGFQLSATVHLEFLSKCELVMKLSDVSLMEHDPEQTTPKPAPEVFNSALEMNHIRVAFQDGHIEELCTTAEEAHWVMNIKRGILSVFQNNMDDLQTEQKVAETDVSGDCEAQYTPGEKGWYDVTVLKSKNLLGCMDRAGYHSAIKGTSYRVPSEIQSLPLMKSSHTCKQSISLSTGRLTTATCQESHIFRPFSRGNSGATTTTTQTLTFVQEKSGVSTPATIKRRVSMKFEHEQDVDKSLRSRKDLERKLLQVCRETESGVRPETPSLFSSIVYHIKNMGSDDLNTVYLQIKDASFCPENENRVRKFFLDAIPMVGTSDSVRLMTQLITAGVVTGVEAEMWLITLAFIQNPTAQMLTEVKPLLSLNDNQEKAMLAVSSLVNSYCRENQGCDESLEVRKIIGLLENKLGAACKVTDNNFQTILYALRAIGNAGFAIAAVPTLNKCMSNSDNPIDVRLSAIEAFHRMNCTADKSQVMRIFINKDEDSEVRVAAYRALMNCPNRSIINKVKAALETEEVNQVGSYVWSHLTNLMETSDPHKQEIRAILEDSTLQKEFDMDKRKFSRNYEGSFFLERLNTGVKAEGDLIWSSKSFIPRSGMVNLTVDLFGESLNLFEIGGRLEGLEYFLESYFGPNGYFSENDVQAAADETALKTIKPDKIGRIDKRFKNAIEELRGNLYLRFFGNELRYMNFKGLESLLSSNINILEILIKMSKGNDYSFTQSAMFLDSSMIIPTSSGFPLNLTVNGTATVDLKASGKMDLMKLSQSPPNLDISGTLQPSGAVEISSMMNIDAFVTRSGVKMVSTMHSSSTVQGHIQMTGGKVISAQWDLPQDKMEIVSVKSAFFTIHRDTVREQRMITQNRHTKSLCTGSKMASITGLELCGELSFPNASLVTDAPYFPLTGPVNVEISLHKRDSFTGYKFEAKSIHNAQTNLMRIAFTTPGANVDRDLVLNMELNKEDGSIDMTFSSPWKKAAFVGGITRQRQLLKIGGKVTYDGNLKYMVNAQVESMSSGPGMKYIPSFELQRANGSPIDLKGTLVYAAMRQVDADFTVNGLTVAPVRLRGTFLNKPTLRRLSATYSAGKNSEYSFESRLQSTVYKLKTVYKPTITIRTPKAEIFAFGGGVTYAPGRQLDINLVMDKVFIKPMTLKGKALQRNFRKGNRKLFNTRMDFTSSIADFRIRSKFDNRNWKTIATDIDFTYNVKQVSRNNLKFVSKMSNLSTKTLTKAKGTMTLAVKRNPELNLKMVGNVNHNFKHSEFDMDVRYGANMKDENKHIEVAAMMNRNIKSLAYASIDFSGRAKHVGQNLNIMAKGSHQHTKRSLETSFTARLNKEEIEASVNLRDQSKEFTNVSGILGGSYSGRSVKIAQILIQSDATTMTSSTTVHIGRNTKHLVVSTWSHPTPSRIVLSSNIDLDNKAPVHVEAEYNFDPANFRMHSSFENGQERYRASISSITDMRKSIQISTDFEIPNRRIVFNYDGNNDISSISRRAELKWDATRDDSQRILLFGHGSFISPDNLNGSISLQYPGRTLSLNVHHRVNSKYISHIDLAWTLRDAITLDTIFTKFDRRHSTRDRRVFGNIKLTTPFTSVRTLGANMELSENEDEYKSNVDLTWNPSKKISTTITVKKFISFENMYAAIDAKTPFSNLRNVEAELTHKYDGGISTVGKLSFNKQSVQANLAFGREGGADRMQVNGEVDIKSTFPNMRKMILAVTHSTNQKGMESSASFQKNTFSCAISSEMKFEVNGQDIETSGKIAITVPDEAIETSWNHRHTPNVLSSSVTLSRGSDVINFNYNGQQHLSLLQGTAYSTFEIQTPFSFVRDFAVQMNHEHRKGLIDTTMKITKDGNQIVSTEAKYLRQNYKIKSSISILSSFTEDFSVQMNSAYDASPKTGHLTITMGPTIVLSVDSTLKDDVMGIMESTLDIAMPSLNFSSVSFKGKLTRAQTEIVSVASVTYGNVEKLYTETRYRMDSVKKAALVVRSPFIDPVSAEVIMQEHSESFTINCNIDMPVMKNWEISTTWETLNGYSSNIRIDTPFNEIPYMQASMESRVMNGARESSVSIEFMPDRVIKIESVHAFSNAKAIDASVKLSTPFTQIPYTALAFNHNGDFREFNNHIEAEYIRGQKIALDTTFSTRNGIEGTLNFKTPFTNDIIGNFGHKGQSDNFHSHADLKWGQYIGADLKFSTGDTVNGAFLLKTSFAGLDVIKATLSHTGSLKQFTTNAELSLSNKTYTASSRLTVTPKITGEISIRTPHSAFENIRTAFDSEGTLDDFTSQATVTLGKSTVASGLTLRISPSFRIKTSLESPTGVVPNIRGGIALDGTVRNFSINADLNHATYGKYIVDIKLDTRNSVDGEISMKTPITGFRNIGASLHHTVSNSSFNTRLEIRNGENLYAGQMDFNLQPMTFEVTATSPIIKYKKIRLSLTHGGKLLNSKTHGELQVNRILSVADLTVKAMKKIDIDFVVKSPYLKPIRAAFDHSGSFKKFNSKFRCNYGRQKVNFAARYQSKPSITGLLMVKSPFRSLKSLAITVKHSGTINNFISTVQTKLNGKTFVANGSFRSVDTMTGTMTMKGSYMKPVNMKFVHEGSVDKYHTATEVSYGKQKVSADTNFDITEGIRATAAITSPFSLLRNVNVDFSHSGVSDNFKSHGKINYNGQNGQVVIALDGTRDIVGTISITSPFEGFEDITVGINHIGTIRRFNTDAQITVNGKKTDATLAFNSENSLSGSAAVKSSYKMIKDMDVAFTHSGNLTDFNSHVEVSVEQQRSELDIHLAMNTNLEGSISIRTPVSSELTAGFEHSNTSNSLSSRAYAGYGINKFSVSASLSRDRIVSGMLKVDTPITGFQSSEVTFQHDGSVENFKTRIELLHRRQRHQADLTFSMFPDIQGYIKVKSPAFKTVEVTFTSAGQTSSLQSKGEILYGKKSQVMIETSFNFENEMSCGFVFMSPHTKNAKISFSHQGQITDFKNHFDVQYGRSKSEMETHFSIGSKVVGGLSINTPFIRKVTASFEHNGPLTNCQTTANISYGGISQFSLNGRSNIELPIDIDIRIQTPYQGFQTMHGLLNYNGDPSSFKLSSEIEIQESKIEGTISFDGSDGELVLKSPFTEDVTGKFTFAGRKTDFQSHGELDYGANRIIWVDCSLDLEVPLNGLLILTLPIHGYETTKIAFQQEETLMDYNGRGELIFGGDTADAIIAVSTDRNKKVSLTFKSSRTEDTSVLMTMNTGNKFDIHADIKYGEITNEMDVTYTNVGNIEGRSVFSLHGFQPIDISVSHTGSLPNIRSQMQITANGQRQIDATISFNMTSNIEGRFSLDFFFLQQINGGFYYSGSLNSFNASGDVVINGAKTGADVFFKSSDKIDGRLSIASPFFKSVSASFDIDGKPINFRSRAIMSIEVDKFEVVAGLNAETALSGDLIIRSPCFENVDASFEHVGPLSNFQSQGRIMYGHGYEFSGTTSFSTTPLDGIVSLRTPIPGFETLAAAFNHKGTPLSFATHADISIGTDRTESDLSFDAGSKLGGSISLKSPYFRGISAEIEISGIISNFRSMAKVVHGAETYFMTTTFRKSPTLVGSMEISTPFIEYRHLQSNFQHSVDNDGFRSTATVLKNDRNMLSVNIDFSHKHTSGAFSVYSDLIPSFNGKYNATTKGQTARGNVEVTYERQSIFLEAASDISQGLEASISLISSFTSDMKANMKFTKNSVNTIAKAGGSYGDKVLSIDANVSVSNGITTAIIIKTPFAGFETMEGSANILQGSNEYSGHAHVTIVDQKTEIDGLLNITENLEGRITIKTPFNQWEESVATIRHTGTLPNIKSTVSFMKSGIKYEANAQLSVTTILTGHLTVKTPIPQYENFEISFQKIGRIRNLQTNAKLVLPSGQEFSGVFENTLSTKLLQTKVEVRTPFTGDIICDVRHNGDIRDFSTEWMFRIGEESVSSVTKLRSEESISFSCSLTTTIHGVSNVQKVDFKHEGHWKHFRNSLYVRVLENEYNFGSSFTTSPKLTGQMTADTPFENFRDLVISFEHGGRINHFETVGNIQYALNKKISGAILFSRLEASVEITTPFEGLTVNKIAYKYTESANGFECHGDITVMETSINGDLQVAGSPLNLVLTVNTPFTGFEQVGGHFQFDFDQAFYHTEASVSLMQGKNILVESGGNINTSAASAFLTVNTPFEGYEANEIRFMHSGNFNDFQLNVNADTSFTGSLTGEIASRIFTVFDVDVDMKFHSQIRNMEILRLNIRNNEVLGKYSSRTQASWGLDSEIIIEGGVFRNEHQGREELLITTPFKRFHNFKLSSDRRRSLNKITETYIIEHNGITVIDYDLDLTLLDRKSGTLVLRSPKPMRIELGGCVEEYKLEADIFVNWNTEDPNSSIHFQGLYENKNDNPVSWKVTHPIYTFGMEVSLENTQSRFQNNAEFFWNDKKVGYNTEIRDTDFKFKLILPSRSLEWLGSQSSRTMEGSFLWDADKDDTNKIGFRSTVFPSEDTAYTKADLIIMMPSVGKNVQLDSEMILNRGRVLFEGKTEFTYSSDSRKKFALTSRLEDISSGANVKNYSFSLGVSHPFTSIGIQLDSHVGQSSERLSAGLDVEYFTAMRQTKSFVVNGEINKLRKSVSLDVDTPVKKINIQGDSQLRAPFRVSLVNKYDNKRPLASVLTYSPPKKMVDFSMNYDIENPRREFHMTAKYVNSSYVQTEMFRVVNRQKIQDALLAIRLNSSHLLHSRVHWRPEIFTDLQKYGIRKINSYYSRMANTMAIVRRSLTEEMTEKVKMVTAEILQEIEPLTIVLLEDLVMLMDMYETNQYYIKDIVDVVIVTAEEARMEMQKVEDAVQTAMSNAISDMSGVANDYIQMSNNVIRDQMIQAKEKLLRTVDVVKREYKRIYFLYADKMYNITQNPTIVNMRQQYSNYISKFPGIPTQEHLANIADQYASAIYSAHALINNHLAGIAQTRSVKTATDAAGIIIQHGKNAYKYWEVRENTEAVAVAIYEWIRSEVMDEVSGIRDAILNCEKSAITVYDPTHGEIQAELYLPLPVYSLGAIPVYNVEKYIRNIRKYVQAGLSAELPSSDVSAWLPPFEAFATIKKGRQVTTFDGLTFDLVGGCTYVLTKDFVDKNFSVSYRPSNNRTMSIFVDGKAVEISQHGEVKVNQQIKSLPVLIRNITVTATDGIVRVDGAGSFTLTFDIGLDIYTIKLNGWYFGKTGGLLGRYDNEPTNDMYTSYGRPINNVQRFSRSWDIGMSKCM